MEVMLVATRKKKGENDSSDVARGFGVVVEEMRGHFRAFGEKLTALDEKVTALDVRVTAGFERVEDRLGRVEHGLARVERRVGQLEERVGRVEEKVGRVEERVGQVEVAILETRHDLKKKVDRDEVEGIVEGVLARRTRR
jgi:septal ring factor EnvC (AmiA/AmiB activator)